MNDLAVEHKVHVHHITLLVNWESNWLLGVADLLHPTCSLYKLCCTPDKKLAVDWIVWFACAKACLGQILTLFDVKYGS